MNKASNYASGNRAWKAVINPEQPKVCPTCEGTGMDKWEEDVCDRCWGEGEL